MATEPNRAAYDAVLEAIHGWFSARSELESRLWTSLDHLDAGRAVNVAHLVADGTRRLREALAGTGLADAEPPNGVAALIAACDDLVRDFGADPRIAGLELPHIGWAEVVEDPSAHADRYGFTSTDSIRTFEELLRYLSGACEAVERLEALSLDVVDEISRASASRHRRCRESKALLSRALAERNRIQRVFERTSSTVREVLGQSHDFAQRRELLRERARQEEDRAVARLLEAIGRVPSRHAWIRRSPASRMTACQPTGDYRLRLSFADGTVHEIHLGEDYWSTTGLAIDPEQFATVSLDRDRNLLVWANGNQVPGERLHLAIEEGRL